MSYAERISADSSTVVGGSASGSGTEEAFRWTRAGGMQPLGHQPGGLGSRAEGVSADGSIIVGWGFPQEGDREAANWTSADGVVWHIQGLGDLPGGRIESYAFDISADTSTVVGTGFPSPAMRPLFGAARTK